MPEGPELHLTMMSINQVCHGLTFSGKVARNPVHKCADIEWDEPAYTLSAESRGKELLVHMQVLASTGGSDSENEVHSSVSEGNVPGIQRPGKATSILFTFGMTGKFAFTPALQLYKHSHLTFFTKDDPKRALSFVDPRRFGKWVQGGQWSADRGPCIIREYSSFVNHIVTSLDCADFQRPICELMLSQKYFSGIGNYLRAEILYRCGTPPFVRANTVLKLRDGSNLKEIDSQSSQSAKVKGSRKQRGRLTEERDELSHLRITAAADRQGGNPVRGDEFIKGSNPTFDMLTSQAQELLELCHLVPLEVVHLGSNKYTLMEQGEDQLFENWLQCYNQAGMTSFADHNKRTIWFSGPAGVMAPTPTDRKSSNIQRNKKSKDSSNKRTQAVAGVQDTGESAHTNVAGTLSGKLETDMIESDMIRASQDSSSRVGGQNTVRSFDVGHKRPRKNKDNVKAVDSLRRRKLDDGGDAVWSGRVTRSAVGKAKV